MTSIADELVLLLGKRSLDLQVLRATLELGLTDVYDDPPLWRYVGSKQQGICLLFEDESVVDVQIYVQSSRTYSAYSDALPFSIRHGMTQDQVHGLLGPPSFADGMTSHYELEGGKRRVSFRFDDKRIIRYMSVGFPVR